MGGGNDIRRFGILSRLGFYATFAAVLGLVAVGSIIGVAMQTENHFLVLSQLEYLLLARGVAGCMFAGFVLSLIAVIAGISESVGFRKARRFYIGAGLSAIVSGLLLRAACFLAF
jgi:hypothetical protein